jgi:nicotinate-nucleotide adenylyltransferase
MNQRGTLPVQNEVDHTGSRVAFFGGSFDPPHLGHLAVARAAKAALGLDTVLFVPVGAQPLKPHGSTAGFEDRLAMTRLAIAGEPGFAVSLADAPKPSGAPNFTIETLLGLRGELPPGGALFCLMGADSFFGLRLWHRAAEIPFVATLIIASRPGQPLEDLQAGLPDGLTIEPSPETDRSDAGVDVRCFTLLNRAGDRTPFYLMPGLHVEISASQIRDQIRGKIQGQAGATPETPSSEDALLPGAVSDYIRTHGLYR